MTRLLERRQIIWFVGALIVVWFLVTNLPWQLDDYDQAKQAFTSFEMVKEGRWFYQQTPHEHVATKPPLVGWISAVFFAMTRSWDLAWRLPSLLAAIALSILLFRTATSTYGAVAGLMALSAFGLNLLTPRLATLVRTDMPLALVIFLIGLQIWNHIHDQRGWDTRDRFLLFLLLAAAMLIKGPIVYAFILPGVLAFVWSLRKIPATARGCGLWPWIGSLSIFLIWVIGGIFLQPGFFNDVVMREFVGRFGETIHRPQPFYFYLPHLLHKFFPWSVLMIALAIVDLRSARWKFRELFRQMSPETYWLTCWSLGGLLVMSLIPSKRVDRIFPIIPPLCLLLAAQIAHALRSATETDVDPSGHGAATAEDEGAPDRVRLWCAIALVLSILFTSAYAILKVVSGYRDHRNALVIFGRDVRGEAERHHWRYEVVSASDEGLLLYLQRPHFIKPDRAVSEWNRGNLDALVVPATDAPRLMRQLRDAAVSQLKSAPRKDEDGLGYLLITR